MDGATFESLTKLAKVKFRGIEPSEPLYLYYRDEDGDVITVSNEDEFQMAFDNDPM